MSFLRRAVTDSQAREKSKELEKSQLLALILESIASVPVAVHKLHTNEKLRQALQDEKSADGSLLHQFLDGTKQDGDDLPHWGKEEPAASLGVFDSYQHSQESSDSSSSFESEYENDLAEAVNQLYMTDSTLTAMDDMISDPIGIVNTAFDTGSARISSSPQSSFGLGASPGNASMDGEPVSALWPRQPNQFAFTQEEDNAARAEDEVYSEMVSSVCEDETFEDDDEEEELADDTGEEKQLFDMEDAQQEALGNGMASFDDANTLPGVFKDVSPLKSQVAVFEAELEEKPKPKVDTVHTVDIKEADDDDKEDVDEDSGDDDDDGEPKDYEVLQLRIIRERNRTGFEPNQDWRPRAGVMIGGRYKVELAIGEAVFSRTYKCLDTATEQSVCLKIIKNNKEYFDQGVDEIRVLDYIDRNCKVDERHLVRLLDSFYFREHLIIVTELLRDNLYEFSRLLLQRGVINYFSIPRLKKITIEVLEALDTLHSLGLVHCDLKPENILIQNFSTCTIKVIDFGSACFVTDELTSYVQSRSYRAPEVILGLLYDQKIDLWSLGCVIAEMFTGEVLFRNDSEQTLLARILATIGPIPASLLADRGDLQAQLIDTGLFAVDHAGNGVLAARVHLPSLEEAVPTKDLQFLDFLRALLQIDPAHRLSARQALTHPWLQHGVFDHST